MAQAIAAGMKPGDKIRSATVKGPGGPKSDSIPAKIGGKNVKLSDGEKVIVIPAAVAQNPELAERVEELQEQLAALIEQATGTPPQEGIEEGGKYATGSVPGDDETKRDGSRNIYADSAIYQGAKNVVDGVKGIGGILAEPVTKTLGAINSYTPNADPRTQTAAPSIATPPAAAQTARPGDGAPAGNPRSPYLAPADYQMKPGQSVPNNWHYFPTQGDAIKAQKDMGPGEVAIVGNDRYTVPGRSQAPTTQAIAAPVQPAPTQPAATQSTAKKPGGAIGQIAAGGPLAEIAADDPLADMKRQFLKGEGKNTVPMLALSGIPGQDTSHPLIPWLKENPQYYFGMLEKRPPADPAAEDRVQEALFLNSLRRLPPALGVAAYQHRYGRGRPAGDATPEADSRTRIAEINAESRRETERIRADGQAEVARIRSGAKSGAQDAGAGGYPHFNTPAEARAARLPPGTLFSTPQGLMRAN